MTTYTTPYSSSLTLHSSPFTHLLSLASYLSSLLTPYLSSHTSPLSSLTRLTSLYSSLLTPRSSNPQSSLQEEGPKNWKKVASMLGATRTDVQCLHRWNKVLKPGLHKGTFTSEEDDTLKLMVERAMNENGPDSVKWSSIAEALQGRIGKQCRERWLNHLDPSIKNEDWTGSEIKIMFLAQRFFGNRWKEIAKMLPGRPENTVKNKWNSSFMRSWLKANNLSKGTGESAHLESTEGMASSLHSFEMALKQEGIALESDLAFNCFDYKVEYNVEETKPFVSDSLDVKVYGTTVT